MDIKEDYIKKEDRKKILLLCDDIRMFSGVSTIAREFVLGTAHHFNWIQVGAGVNHPDKGKLLDISESVNKLKGLTDASVRILPYDGYGDAQLIRFLVATEKPSAVIIFTDPRYWGWLFDIEREIRSKIPIFWLNIWDNYPAPFYNKIFYDSVDVLMAISKQTKNINRIVLGEKADDKLIKYVPHGINEDSFYPAEPAVIQDLKKTFFKEKDIGFTVLWNSRNIHRKRPGDIVTSYRVFCDLIGKEKARKCALVMHTDVVDANGTDLRAVKEALCDPDYINIYFSQDKASTEQMNVLYNIADVTLSISSNEGWGLSLTESMMAGTMIIGAVTGGLQDQFRFEDEEGNWIDFDDDFLSNHRGTYKKCGEWGIPVFPSNIALTGSPVTPYIFDDRVRFEDVANAIKEVYDLSKEERDRRGMMGRIWVTSDESNMSARRMCNTITETLEEGMSVFIPRPEYDLIKIEERPSNYVPHKLVGY